MDIRYREEDFTVRANISNQGCALFGLSLVICKMPQMAIERSELLRILYGDRSSFMGCIRVEIREIATIVLQQKSKGPRSVTGAL